MRALLAAVLLFVSSGVSAVADTYQQLYQAAGWPQQRQNFIEALHVAQQRYQDKLPAALYLLLVQNSDHRFAAEDIDRRGLAALRAHLPDSQAALAFFESPLGLKVVTAEVTAASQAQLQSSPAPLPSVSERRQALIQRLGKAIPYAEAGADTSLALAGIAADGLSQMLPGMSGQGSELLQGQRQRLLDQIDRHLNATLLRVYRDLSDDELERFIEFAESPDGQTYYQAAAQVVREALAGDVTTTL